MNAAWSEISFVIPHGFISQKLKKLKELRRKVCHYAQLMLPSFYNIALYTAVQGLISLLMAHSRRAPRILPDAKTKRSDPSLDFDGPDTKMPAPS